MESRAQPLELIPGLALRVSSLRPAGHQEVTTNQALTEITEFEYFDLGNVHLLLQIFIHTFNWLYVVYKVSNGHQILETSEHTLIFKSL